MNLQQRNYQSERQIQESIHVKHLAQESLHSGLFSFYKFSKCRKYYIKIKPESLAFNIFNFLFKTFISEILTESREVNNNKISSSLNLLKFNNDLFKYISLLNLSFLKRISFKFFVKE